MSVNLTYLRTVARRPLPARPGSWENFSSHVDDACDELEGYRRDISDMWKIVQSGLDDGLKLRSIEIILRGDS